MYLIKSNKILEGILEVPYYNCQTYIIWVPKGYLSLESIEFVSAFKNAIEALQNSDLGKKISLDSNKNLLESYP